MMVGTKVTTGTGVTTGTNITTGTEVAPGTEVATGVGTDIPIGMVIRTTAIKTAVTSPVFQGEYPGWSCEPGFLPGSFQMTPRRAEGQDPVRKMDNGSPEVLESI
jgi:hypothetical protein